MRTILEGSTLVDYLVILSVGLPSDSKLPLELAMGKIKEIFQTLVSTVAYTIKGDCFVISKREGNLSFL